MIIKVLDKNNEDKYLIDASWIKWSRTKSTYSIAVYTHVTTTKSIGSTSKSEIEVAQIPSMYLHLYHGDMVYIMNNHGKTIDKKRIVIFAEDQPND
jgi:hypothetical protein